MNDRGGVAGGRNPATVVLGLRLRLNGETRQDATSAVPEHNTTKVKHHATDARNMTLCEKVITVDMTKLLNNLLVRISADINRRL